MSNLCRKCDKWQKKQEDVLMRCESIFDVAIDMQMFEEDCIKTCPYLKEIVDNSGN